MAKKMKYNANEELGKKWEDLNPEILALILVKIPVEERVATASLVCKSWMSCVLLDPLCWVDIDIRDWTCNHHQALEYVDSVVENLVRRSNGTVRHLYAFYLGDPGFVFTAKSARCLKVLVIPRSEVSDKSVVKYAESLANLTVLDISYCKNITHVGIEAFGKNNKSMIKLNRNMTGVSRHDAASRLKVNELEAMAVADTMPLIQHLELDFRCFGDYGLGAILDKCKALTHLEIEGCWNVKLEEVELYFRCTRLSDFTFPWAYKGYDDEYPSSDSDSSDSDTSDSDSSDSDSSYSHSSDSE